MGSGKAVQLRVGGQNYRVVTSASEDDLRRLAAVVDERLARVVPPGRVVTPQAMLLAAIGLAHELEEERQRASDVAARARLAVGRLLDRVDAAIGESTPEPPAVEPAEPR